MRNVPVGGGCRRNKRSKGRSSKSPASSSGDRAGSSAGGVTSSVSSGSGLGLAAEMLGLGGAPIPSLRLMPPLQYLTTDFGSGDQIGMSYSGIPQPLGAAGDLNFPAASVLGAGGNFGSLLSGGGGLRLPQVQQFPFLGGSDPYPFDGSVESSELMGQVRPRTPTSGVITQLASVKMEDSKEGLNLSRQFPGSDIGQGNDQFSTWNTSGTWTDISGFSSSSTSNPP